ncbi:MAG TPA: biotin/lipoyl-containing protein [Opitutus sp.]|nr:biotin/lipoyl-containing protein [Opitutus sp.]
MKKLRVTVEGKVYEVLVEILDGGATASPTSTGVPTPTVSSSAVVSAATPTPARNPVSAGAGDVASPLAGKIVSIDVKTGDAVTEGAQLATIEAMKMNTYVFAPKAGRIGGILVKPGDGIEEGGLILRMA